jgi:hypothetical protein
LVAVVLGAVLQQKVLALILKRAVVAVVLAVM